MEVCNANGSTSSRLSCDISEEEIAKRNAIAGVRILVSFLSIVGSLSIIVSVVVRKQVSSPKVHPIFVLSVADCVLGFTWVTGGLLWYTRTGDRVWCFLPSLLSVVLECVTVNLTLVYAVFAYLSIKNRNLIRDLASSHRERPEAVMRPWAAVSVYCLAWLLPVLLIMVPFGIDAGLYHITEHANACSCWCLPYFGNVLPMAFPEDHATAVYVRGIRKLVASYGVVIGTNYLVVFILLIAIYYKLLKYIQRLRRQHEQLQSYQPNYGAVNTLIVRSEPKARRSVIVFLTVFVITGCFNFVLSYVFTVFESIQLHGGDPAVQAPRHDHLQGGQFALYLLQSVTVPLQGFLNAIVYGWTREDFVTVVARTSVVHNRGRLSRSASELEHSSSLQVSGDQSFARESSRLLTDRKQ